jgi:hypothetical protein
MLPNHMNCMQINSEVNVKVVVNVEVNVEPRKKYETYKNKTNSLMTLKNKKIVGAVLFVIALGALISVGVYYAQKTAPK